MQREEPEFQRDQKEEMLEHVALEFQDLESQFLTNNNNNENRDQGLTGPLLPVRPPYVLPLWMRILNFLSQIAIGEDVIRIVDEI